MPTTARRADPVTRRTLADGGVVVGGVEADGTHAWRGIPYAAPPVGALRWRAPSVLFHRYVAFGEARMGVG